MEKKETLEMLQGYIELNYPAWRKLYSENLHGVHVGRKMRGGKELERFSIVFHVSRKGPAIGPPIPSRIACDLGGPEPVEIETDVIEESGMNLLGLDLGDKARNAFSPDFGRIGAFLKSDSEVYACSNMHVLAPGLLESGLAYYENPRETQRTPDVRLGEEGFEGFLERCVFDGIDAGVARIANPAAVSGLIPSRGVRPRGYTIVSWSNYRGYSVRMPMTDTSIQEGVVLDIGVVMSSPVPDRTLRNLIKVSLLAEPGDSGSPVYDLDDKLIGMLVGGTETCNYLIPIASILNYFKMDLY